jgi:hypothetical protein
MLVYPYRLSVLSGQYRVLLGEGIVVGGANLKVVRQGIRMILVARM